MPPFSFILSEKGGLEKLFISCSQFVYSCDCRGRFSLVRERSKAKTQAKTLLIQLFPEFSEAFSDMFGVTASAVLRSFPSARALSLCPANVLAELLSQTSRGRFGKAKAEYLIGLSKDSIGTQSIALELELQMLLQQIDLFTAQIAGYEAAIKSVMEKTDSPITTIPGIGYVLGAVILSEIGDISRFSTPAKLQAYAGVDPSISDSGSSVSAPGRMVKHGSRYLRWALCQAARCVSLYDPVFAAYMQSKRNEGKHYCVACSHVAKKLTRVIYSLLKNNSVYSPTYSLLSA